MIDRKLIAKRIYTRPGVQQNRPCIKGTRIPVYVILEALATGLSFKRVIKEFKPITMKDINACMLYAALLADQQELVSQKAG